MTTGAADGGEGDAKLQHELFELLRREAGLGGGAREPPAPRRDPRRAPLSSAQARLWFAHQYDPTSPVYHIPITYRFTGDLCHRALERSLAELVRRHDALRTCVDERGHEATQVFSATTRFVLPVIDLAELPRSLGDAELDRQVALAVRRPFDLSRGPLLRAVLIRRGTADTTMVVTIHHIAADGWSVRVLNRELAALYAAFAADRPSPLPANAASFGDYAEQERRELAQRDWRGHEAFWTKHLAGELPAVRVHGDRARQPLPGGPGATATRGIAPALRAAIEAVGHDEGVVPSTFLLATFYALLARYTGQRDLIVGVPVANRSRAEWRELVGLVINTLPLRVDLADDPPFRVLLARMRTILLDALEFQDLPLERILALTSTKRDPSSQPPFRHLFVLQEVARSGSVDTLAGVSDPTVLAPWHLELVGVQARPLGVTTGAALADLTLTIVRRATDFTLSIDYSTELYDESTIQRLADHYERLLASAAGNPALRVSELPMLAPAEWQRVAAEWSPRACEPAPPARLHSRFQERVTDTPDAIAIATGEAQLSYAELNRRANQLARHLQALGAGPETVVGLCVERSNELVIGVLGILKAGAAYLPLDPEYPEARLRAIALDAGAICVVTQAPLAARLALLEGCCVRLDADRDVLARCAAQDLPERADPDDLAYVIYTSGSTGKPKGVEITHRCATRLFTVTQPDFGFGADDVWLLFHSAAFDVSVWEIFGALLNGGRLIVVPHWVARSADDLMELITDESVTVLNQTPSAFRQLDRADRERAAATGRRLDSLRYVVFAGERLELRSLGEWFARYGDRAPRLINMYGITETTVHVTYRALTISDATQATAGSPIGLPFADLGLYLLDEHAGLVPVGAAGEIHVGGAGVARAYRRRPALTAERFRPQGFGTVPGARLYRSGDLARRASARDFEYFARIDKQVKIRGYRIELGEIEAALESHRDVDRAIVLLRQDGGGEPRLVAYTVVRKGTSPTAAALRAHLSERLPNHMVPADFVRLDDVPLTNQGKLDIAALPAREQRHDAAPPELPSTAIEVEVARIWREVLGLAQVAVHENFFDLGGHSLLAQLVVARLHETFAVDLPLRAFFASPTIRALAATLESTLEATGRKTERAPRSAIGPKPRSPAPLSFAQERLWLLERMSPGDPVFNVHTAFRLTGDLHVSALERALNDLVARHDTLRATFRLETGRPVQLVAAHVELALAVHDLRHLDQPARDHETQRLRREELQQPFDLEHGPLIRVRLIRLQDAGWMLLRTLHHVVCDEWSLGVFNRELSALYRAAIAGSDAELPALPIQYSDFSTWQRHELDTGAFDEQMRHWQQRLAEPMSYLTLAGDRARRASLSTRGGCESFEFPLATATAIRKSCGEQDATLFIVLAAAFQFVLHRWTGEKDIVIGTPVANRNRPETENLIGFFVNMIVLRNDVTGDVDFAELVRRTKIASLDALANQDVPFERLVASIRPRRDFNQTPFFGIVFTLQHATGTQLELDGISAQAIDVEIDRSLYDVSLVVTEDGPRLQARVYYKAELLEPPRMRQLLADFAAAIEYVARNPTQPLGKLQFDLFPPKIPPAVRQRLLVEWNDTRAADAGDTPVHTRFEAVAARTPDAVAVSDGNAHLTFAALDARADALARTLQAEGVTVETCVGLALPRSLETPLAMLAVLKAGAAFVPLDPTSPAPRLSQQLMDANVHVLLTQRGFVAPTTGSTVISVDEFAARVRATCERPATWRAGPDSLAYCIFTSGSTGRPKGVMVCHRGLANLVAWHVRTYELKPGDRCSVVAAPAFDASVWEIWPALASGASLHVPPPAACTLPADLMRWMAKESIDVAFVPTPLAALAVNVPPPAGLTLRALLTGGDKLHAAPEQPLSYRLINHYGPTECSVVATAGAVESARVGEPSIGRPISNIRAYVLGPSLDLLAPGQRGELHLTGDGLARGYLERPGETAVAFVPSPFAATPGERMYRSGDQCWHGADGQLSFAGRIDQQIKIRGQRIEIGEIETTLRQHPAVREAAVVAVDAGGAGTQLSAYVVGRDGERPARAELQAFLRERLPSVMIPSAFSLIEALPLSPNGKVDRRALPTIDRRASEPDDIVEPQTNVERTIAAAWRDVLHLDRVGLHENFFDIGGHSLLLIELHQLLTTRCEFSLSVTDLFRFPTIHALANHVTRGTSDPDLGEQADRTAQNRSGRYASERERHRQARRDRT